MCLPCPYLQEAYDADTLENYHNCCCRIFRYHNDVFSKVYATSKETQMKFLEAVCSGNAVAGDQLERVLRWIYLWPIHPTTERFQYKKVKDLL